MSGWKRTCTLVVLLSGLVGINGADAQIRRVSLSNEGSPIPGADGGVMSRNGRFVVFSTIEATSEGVRTDIFVRDLEARTTTQLPITFVRYPTNYFHISDDGGVIAFSTRARLLPGVSNKCPREVGLQDCQNVYVYERSSGLLTRASVASDGRQVNGESTIGTVSGNGRYVFFVSNAADLVPGDLNGQWDVFRRDRVTGQTIRVSLDSQGGDGRRDAYNVQSTPDGQTIVFVADGRTFESNAEGDYSPERVFVRDLATGTTRRLETSAAWGPARAAVTAAKISADGQTIAVNLQLDRPFGGVWEIHDLKSGAVITSASFFQSVRWDLADLALSDDGRLLAFIQNRETLKIFDRLTGLTESISASDYIGRPSFGSAGQLLAFTSSGKNLVPDDTEPGSDVFVLDRDADHDGIPTYWETAFGLDPNNPADAASDTDGDGLTALQEFQANSNPIATTTRYFAEGAANDFFTTRVAVLNPGTMPTTVMLRFLGANGQITSQTQTIPASGRATFNVANAPDTAFSIAAEGSKPFVADRLMTWDQTGYGSSLETAVAAPGTSWHFAEGATGGPYSLYYLLQNPGATDAQAAVTYLRPAPLPPIVKSHTVPAHSRLTIDVRGEDAGLAAGEVSGAIAADQPIVAERAMYFSSPGTPMVAGHDGAGIAAPALHWFLPEGATGFFDEFVLIANPGSDEAKLTVRYLLEDGTNFSEPVTVAGQSRFTVEVKTRDPRLAATPVSVIVDSTNAVPVVVERVMWWPHGGWYEASLSAGVTATGTRWAIAEAEQGGPSAQQTYVLIANTEHVDAHATMNVVYEDGTTPDTRDLLLKANSRTSVSLGSFPGAAGKRFGIIVESVGGAQIVVERSLYSSPNGLQWSAGATSVATDISNWP